MSRKRITMLAILVVFVVAVTLGVKALSAPGSAARPEHISIAQAKKEPGQLLKIGGDVLPGSISFDNARQLLKFTLSGGGDDLPVVYGGVAPNDFKPGSAVVVEGTYSASGVFQATSLTTRGSVLCKACHG